MTGIQSDEPVMDLLVAGGEGDDDVDRGRRRWRVAPAAWTRWAQLLAVAVVVLAAPVTFVVDLQLAARATLPRIAGEEVSLPDRVFPVPLHAPVVGPGSPLGQPAAVLLGGVPRASGLVGASCCSLAVVGATTDVSAFLDLPGLRQTRPDGWLARLSADGRTVAYSTGRGVRWLNLVDGTSHSTGSPSGLAVASVLGWSYDGSRLLVEVARSEPGSVHRLAVVDVAGAGWTLLAAPDRWTGSQRAAALSADGSQVGFVQDGQLWVERVGGPPPAEPVVTGLESPGVTWGWDTPGIRVLSASPGPDGVVAPGARREIVIIGPSPGMGAAYRQAMDGDYDSATLLTHAEGEHATDVLVVAHAGRFALARLTERTSTLSVITPLPAPLDAEQVDVAAGPADGFRLRPAGPPADPWRAAALRALAVGLVAAGVLTVASRRVRQRILSAGDRLSGRSG